MKSLKSLQDVSAKLSEDTKRDKQIEDILTRLLQLRKGIVAKKSIVPSDRYDKTNAITRMAEESTVLNSNISTLNGSTKKDITKLEDSNPRGKLRFGFKKLYDISEINNFYQFNYLKFIDKL